MFDIGFSELIVIGIVALVVIGPERLPRVARTAGLLLGRMQRYVNEVKADINREIQLDELKKLQSDVQQSVHDFERGFTDEMRSIERSVEEAADSVAAGVRPSGGTAPDDAADGEPPREAVKE
jgi:sec-independent protein translocase protein TatB